MTLKECDMVLESTLNLAEYYFTQFYENAKVGDLDWELYNKGKYWIDENIKYLKVKDKLTLLKIRKDAFDMIRFMIRVMAKYVQYHKFES